MNQLLKPEEVGALLKIKEGTIRRWIFQRRIPVVRVGRAVRIRVEDVERLVRDGLTPAIGDRR